MWVCLVVFLGWLVGGLGLCVLSCFPGLPAHFRALLLWEFCLCFSCTLGALGSIVTLGAPLCHLWLIILHAFHALGLSLLIFGFRLGAPGVHFSVFLWLWGRTLDPFFDFSGKARKRYKKEKKKGAEMDAFSMGFRAFPENAKVRFDCAAASGLRFRPLLFLLCAPNFAFLFVASICCGLGIPLWA